MRRRPRHGPARRTREGSPVSGGLILAVESSCDETGIALIEDGRLIRANVVASQVALHAPTGGIVPEVAARAHLRWMVPVLDDAWSDAGATWDDVDAVAVTYGPGLAGSLLVGINFAKALAWVHDRPLVGVNHLEGHVYAAWLRDPGEAGPPRSGLPARGPGRLGRPHLPRRDARPPDLPAPRHDPRRRRGRGVRQGRAAAGARLPGRAGHLTSGRGRDQPRPGLPAGMAGRLVRPQLLGSQDGGPPHRSTAARADAGLADTPEAPLPDEVVAELAWGFQDAVVDVLVTKTIRAAEESDARSIVLGGGVAANAPCGPAGRRGGGARPAADRAATGAVHR